MITNLIIPAAEKDSEYEGVDLLLPDRWNVYMPETISTRKWKIQQLNTHTIGTVNLLWSYLNMFFVINGNMATCPLDLENMNRKELSFFRAGIYPNWDRVKSSKKYRMLTELKIKCRNRHQEFILYVILALVGETFSDDDDDEEDESYIKNILGCRICPYKQPSMRLWLADFSDPYITRLKSNLQKIWHSLYNTKIFFSLKRLF